MFKDLANHLGIHVELLSPALKEWEANYRIFSIDHDERPQDHLFTEPSRVVSAAHEEASGVMYG